MIEKESENEKVDKKETGKVKEEVFVRYKKMTNFVDVIVFFAL